MQYLNRNRHVNLLHYDIEPALLICILPPIYLLFHDLLHDSLSIFVRESSLVFEKEKVEVSNYAAVAYDAKNWHENN